MMGNVCRFTEAVNLEGKFTIAPRGVILRYPNAKASVHEPDLANFIAVQELASEVSAAIVAGACLPSEFHHI